MKLSVRTPSAAKDAPDSPSKREDDERQTIAEDARTYVHWGNDGFCVDVALHHPRRAGDVTVGVLCDGTRYPKAADPVEWELFRTALLEGQGWKLVRLWTPHFFRDPESAREKVLQAASEQIARKPPVPDTQGRGETRRVLN